jgi:hypothetical protein
MFSVVSGFAVFAALGHLAYLEGVDVEDLDYGGFSLGESFDDFRTHREPLPYHLLTS